MPDLNLRHNFENHFSFFEPVGCNWPTNYKRGNEINQNLSREVNLLF
jgi:hypothetical protein